MRQQVQDKVKIQVDQIAYLLLGPQVQAPSRGVTSHRLQQVEGKVRTQLLSDKPLKHLFDN
jgi:hypothetical protein